MVVVAVAQALQLPLLAQWLAFSLLLAGVASLLYRVYRRYEHQRMVSQTQVEQDAVHYWRCDVTRAAALLQQAETELGKNATEATLRLSHQAISDTLAQLVAHLQMDSRDLSIVDMASLLQSRGLQHPVSEPVRYLHGLYLQLLQGRHPSLDESRWAWQTARWFVDIAQEARFRFAGDRTQLPMSGT